MSDLQIFPKWCEDAEVYPALASVFSYGPGDDRTTGSVFAKGEQDWPDSLRHIGPMLLVNLEWFLGIQFTIVAFQAYRNGAGCDWHTDAPFDAQAVLSLGATRTFAVRRLGDDPTSIFVEHGDLVYMPSGFQEEWEHCVPVENVRGERCSLVFRTPKRG